MKFLLNGEPCVHGDKVVSLIDMLALKSMTDQKGIAIAVNQQVVSRSQWADFKLKENDEVLIIKATQGG